MRQVRQIIEGGEIEVILNLIIIATVVALAIDGAPGENGGSLRGLWRFLTGTEI